jgi:hypothetical protein
MTKKTPKSRKKKIKKSRALAKDLFPEEKWVFVEENIWCAKSRLGRSRKEQVKLFREIADVRILTERGSVAFFLPERAEDEQINREEIIKKMHADTIIDGVVVELKTISGNRATLGKSFRRGYKQGRSLLIKHGITADHSVFIRIFSSFNVESVKAKIAGELKYSSDNGYCICFFEATKELYYWSYNELRAIIAGK